MQAYLAILRYDVGQLARSWIARLWFPLLIAPALFLVVVAGTENERASETMAIYISAVLLPISALAIAVLTSSAVSAELNVIADGILSRSVTRSEYLWAKITARLGFALGVYLLVMLPFSYLIIRYAAPDTSIAGVVVGILVVGVLLMFLGSLGIALSTILSNTLLAVLTVLLAVIASGVVLQFLGLHWMSATAVINELPRTFRGETPPWDLVRVVIVFVALTATALMASLWVFRHRDL